MSARRIYTPDGEDTSVEEHHDGLYEGTATEGAQEFFRRHGFTGRGDRHAVTHIIIENISLLAADWLQDSGLDACTERDPEQPRKGEFHTPLELGGTPLEQLYGEHTQRTMEDCEEAARRVTAYLNAQGGPSRYPAQQERRNGRIAREACQAMLPAATLTAVGITTCAEPLARCITSLSSSPMMETQGIAEELREQGKNAAPELMRSAVPNGKLTEDMEGARPRIPGERAPGVTLFSNCKDPIRAIGQMIVSVPRTGEKAVTALGQLEERLTGQGGNGSLTLPREFEAAAFTAEMILDYRALRELRRQRAMTLITPPMSAELGRRTPGLLEQAGAGALFNAAMDRQEGLYRELLRGGYHLAQYAVTQAHMQYAAAVTNLREMWEFLRTEESAQDSTGETVRAMLREFQDRCPELAEMLERKRPLRKRRKE